MTNTAGKTSLYKRSKKYYALIGLFIMTIAVVHFALQMIFIQKENSQSVETAVEIEKNIEPDVETVSPARQIIEIEPEQYEVKKVEIIKIPEYFKPAPRRRRQEISPAPKIEKKKESGGTRAERLRRAERILTGV